MKQISFIEGVIVALLASAAGAILFFLLSGLLGDSSAFRMVISMVSAGYILYLFRRSHNHIGRITLSVFWLLSSLALWLLWPPISLFILANIAAIWLIRSLYFHERFLSALSDLSLTGLSFLAGLWAIAQTGSLFLTFWCFFLVQALCLLIPKTSKATSTIQANADFDHAYKNAESALHKLAKSH